MIGGLGIFAIPEIVSLLRQDRAIARSGEWSSGWMAGVKDWFEWKWLSLRSTILGAIVGMIPGLGG